MPWVYYARHCSCGEKIDESLSENEESKPITRIDSEIGSFARSQYPLFHEAYAKVNFWVNCTSCATLSSKTFA